MKIISGMFKSAYMVLGKQKYISTTKYAIHPYLCRLTVDEGVLLHNVLTREIVLMLRDEWMDGQVDKITDSTKKQLVEHWYLIPENTDAKTLNYTFQNCHAVKFEKGSGRLELCTVFTTTRCNARCSYCYETGCNKRSMTRETALEVAKFIESHCNSENVHLKWFGGEPLCNPSVIDIICGYLQEHRIKYDSSMVSNGYLIDQQDADKLRRVWRLNRVQITLDGTQEEYNKIKNYKTSGNAFEHVMNGIRYLLELEIQINIRLNLSKQNFVDLIKLVDILKSNFDRYSRLITIYSHPLFEGESFKLTKKERAMLYSENIMLHEYISKTGLGMPIGIPKIRHDHCMADNGRSTVILPGGELSLCEHHCDDEYYGTIYNDEYNLGVIQSWSETAGEIEECRDCFYYPACSRLKKCPGKTQCNEEWRTYNLAKVHLYMMNAYNRRLK